VQLSIGQGFGRLVAHDPLARSDRSTEGVHQMRVAARRLRAHLGLLAPALKRAPSAELRSELRWLGSLLGPVRDLDTVVPLLHEAIPDEGASEAARAIDTALEAERGTARAAMAAALMSKRYRHLLRSLADAVIEPPTRKIALVPARGIVHPELRSASRALTDAVDDLGDTPSDQALHRVRILAKRLRYGAELAAEIDGPRAAELAERLAEAQDHLGDARDLVRALSIIDEVSQARPELSAPMGEMRAALKAQSGSHHDAWRAPFGACVELLASLGWSRPGA
jgi:CHAD domain-containing protein